ncbi:MAG: type I restriction endonuclease subunit R, partial [Pseudomonadota bacterium]|nr:type I restriction endonuclease subunit R [Pseudomonadota bacterium]
MSGHTETDFENAIEHGLTTQGGYTKGDPKAFDEALALFPSDVTGFMRASQPTRWAQLGALLGTKIEAIVIDALTKELELKGTLHVLRHGFRCYGKTLRMAYFRPNTSLNPEAAALYATNRLTITRQVAFASVLKKPDGGNRCC